MGICHSGECAGGALSVAPLDSRSRGTLQATAPFERADPSIPLRSSRDDEAIPLRSSRDNEAIPLRSSRDDESMEMKVRAGFL
jgi:hypothetical protein